MPFKKVSADEAKAMLEKRKEHLRDTASGPAILRAMKAPPSWDGEKRTARFVMSSESVDRYKDIVSQAGLDITRFLENPQALLFHNSRSWPIGNWSDITKILNGRPKRTEGTLNFMPADMDPDCDRAVVHVAAGTIRTVSIGFIPNWDEIEFILDEDEDWTGGFRYNESELIECSLVPIPAQPDAMAKSADGDMVLARELIEDVLDNWARSPEGLIIPRVAYEAAYMDVVGERSTFIIDLGLSPAPAAFVPKAALALNATTDEEARALVGATVTLDPAHAENKGWPFDVLAKAEGEIIASYIVAEGEFKGVHALWVEFLTDAYSGMFRGIKAERFVLVPAKEGAAPTDPAPEPAAPEEPKVKTVTSAAEETGDVQLDTITIPLKLDSAEAEAGLGRVSGLLDGLAEKIGKIFGVTKSAKGVEPVVEDPPAPPSPEAISAAKSRAADTLARLQAKGF